MQSQSHIPPTTGDVISEGGGLLVSLGIFAMVLCPFALPGLALLALVAVPLLAVGLVLALVAAILAAPVMAVRALRGAAW